MLNFLLPYKTYILAGLGALIVSGLTYGAYKVYTYHIETVKKAEIAAENKVIRTLQEARIRREDELLGEAEEERKRLEVVIASERAKVRRLEEQLLIEHDLDRLLQAKPELILRRVNAGTKEVFKELEEITK